MRSHTQTHDKNNSTTKRAARLDIYIYIYIYIIYIYIYIYIARVRLDREDAAGGEGVQGASWPLHDIVITNRVKGLPSTSVLYAIHHTRVNPVYSKRASSRTRAIYLVRQSISPIPMRVPTCAIDLNTIVPFPIVYGVWRIKRRSREGRILSNTRATVFQWCGQCRLG